MGFETLKLKSCELRLGELTVVSPDCSKACKGNRPLSLLGPSKTGAASEKARARRWANCMYKFTRCNGCTRASTWFPVGEDGNCHARAEQYWHSHAADKGQLACKWRREGRIFTVRPHRSPLQLACARGWRESPPLALSSRARVAVAVAISQH